MTHIHKLESIVILILFAALALGKSQVPKEHDDTRVFCGCGCRSGTVVV